MVSDLIDDESSVRVNRKSELSVVSEGASGNSRVGISYLTGDVARRVEEKIKKLAADKRYEESFWEEALYDKDRMIR